MSEIRAPRSGLLTFASEAWTELTTILEEIKEDVMGDTTHLPRRSDRRLHEAKKRARPELNKYGWDTIGYAESMRLPSFTDNIERVDAAEMSVQEFRDKFERSRMPCIMTGLTDKWQANDKWTVDRIARKYRNQRFKCGEDDDGYSVKLKMKYYIEYMKTNRDDSPLYIFDSGFGARHKTKQLLEDYDVPPMFKDDLFNYADFKKRPPHRWFVMGPARSGTAIHIDPLGTSAWNSLIRGHKRWVLIHPDAPRALVKPYDHEKGKHGDEAVTWFTHVYPRVRASTWPEQYPVIEARQGPGDTMFVPSGWWHVVINEDETIAITQNYCSVENLHLVWPKTVRGRPKLSKQWFRRLSRDRPELIPIMEQSLKTPSTGDSSSDSSSSSSSSDDSSSEEDDDSGCGERVPASRKRKLSDTGNGAPCNGDTSSQCASKLHRSPNGHRNQSEA